MVLLAYLQQVEVARFVEWGESIFNEDIFRLREIAHLRLRDVKLYPDAITLGWLLEGDVVSVEKQNIRRCIPAREVQLHLFDIINITIRGINTFYPPKHERRSFVASRFEWYLAEIVFRDPGFRRGGDQLCFEMVVDILDFSKRNTGKVTVAARIWPLGRVIIVSALFLVLLWSSGLPALVAQPVRLARLSVPSLDETGQDGKSPQGSFKSHAGVRIQPFSLRCKQFMSKKGWGFPLRSQES